MRNDKLARLKISFMLAKNELTEHEKKTVFIRILDPDGSTLFDAATGSGSFIFEGKDYAYTTKAEIYYDNINQFVEVAYHRGTAYRSVNTPLSCLLKVLKLELAVLRLSRYLSKRYF
jgi:hypothetical protein